jgi:two-component system sensor histidine kinase ArlS
MTIRTKLTLLFTLITAGILLAFAAIIYYSAVQSREKEFYALLEKEAITKSNLFFDAKLEPKILQDIYLRNREVINEVEVAIYDKEFNLLYHDAVDIDFVKETKGMIDSVFLIGSLRFYQNDWQVIGMKFTYSGVDYVVTAAAFDYYGYTKLRGLKQTILLVWFFSVFIIFISGMIFSKRIFVPIKQMIRKTNAITATNLDLRLETTDSKDELTELALTFNAMLDRLENSFDAQKHFVSNISHEIRTPLAAIIAELELSKCAERNIQEYKSVVENVLNDAHKMNRLANSLLDFAKASYDTSEIAFKILRIDELLLDARQDILKANPSYTVDILYENENQDEYNLLANGNAYLLKVAFANLFENGCKFSEIKQSVATISFDTSGIVICFADKGIGIPSEDLVHVFTPFYRGVNGSFAEGNGIGLSLTQKIIHLHQGQISVNSVCEQGTTFRVVLPSC